ncbi:universal stress protein [Nocardioides panacis]|uniref:Universal stress protein n=1 Tax=Nocardioides panacis TaxID=2849501 RepID=A0A975T170_9ACTN|nr:universal stress protein [Nocardioides panacis]QWZ09748.1 universal stress protein [Nocardioides panacis]
MDRVATTADASGGLLVGHDGSPASSQAVRWAARIAARLGCPLLVVRTWSLSSAPRPSTWAAGYVPPLTDFEAAVRERLRADVAALGLPEGAGVTCQVLHGAAGRRLVESSRGAEMLVVGSRGTGGFLGLVMGSTAAQVVGHAACPVVVVPVDVQLDGQPTEPDSGLAKG